MKIPYYRVAMQETTHRLHRDLPQTRLWTYGSSLPGPTIEMRSGRGVLVEWINALPTRHLLPIDHKLHGAEADKPAVRAVVQREGAAAERRLPRGLVRARPCDRRGRPADPPPAAGR